MNLCIWEPEMGPDPKTKTKAMGGKTDNGKGKGKDKGKNNSTTTDAVVAAATLATSATSNEEVARLIGESEARRSGRKQTQTEGANKKRSAISAASYLGGSYSW